MRAIEFCVESSSSHGIVVAVRAQSRADLFFFFFSLFDYYYFLPPPLPFSSLYVSKCGFNLRHSYSSEMIVDLDTDTHSFFLFPPIDGWNYNVSDVKGEKISRK